MVRSLKNGDQIRQTITRFRKTNDYESYVNAIDQDYESEDAIFNGYIYKLNTHHNLMLLKDLNMEMDVISCIKLLNIEVIFVFYQQKVVVLSNLSIS